LFTNKKVNAINNRYVCPKWHVVLGTKFGVEITVYFFFFCDERMSLEQKMSELRGNGCSGHSAGVPYESHLVHSDIVRPGVNPFVHRLHFSALDRLQV